MEGDGSQPTQATQRALDPRRVGQQNSGFSDDEISDIVCILYPYSSSARREVSRIAHHDQHHVVGTEDAVAIEPDYSLEDDASRFQAPQPKGDYAIILRLSALVKNQIQGFQFGRNAAKCDICFVEDPKKRLSNVHFRVYVNNFGIVMLEDQSTNGTFVDNELLRAKIPNPHQKRDVRRQLTHGCKIKVLMHDESEDLVFLVRIPRREGEHHARYMENVGAYYERLRKAGGPIDETMITTPGGHPDLFSTPRTKTGTPVSRQVRLAAAGPSHPQYQTEWRGSEKYSKVSQIGKGAFAVVHKVTSRYDGKPYAAKELEKRRFVKNGILDQKVENEMKIMQQVTHPNIVQYVDHFDWENRLLIIIMELVNGGDLGRLVSERGALPELVGQSMASQMLSALGYLHKKNITHRDVKPDNILVSAMNPFTVKLTDFGLSKMVDTEQTFLRTFCGTLLYCAPEVYNEYAEYDDHGFRQPRKARRPPPGQRYDHAVDIWSLGGVIFYALTTKPPYPVKSGISYSELLHQIMTTDLNVRPLVERDTSPAAIDFLQSMLNRRPENRARVEELAEHRWMRGAEEDSVDEIIQGVSVSASQMSLKESESKSEPEPSQQVEPGMMDEMDSIVDDFVMEDSPDFDETFGKPGGGPPRLFGEVNVSAVGSSGVIPEDRLNISLPGDSRADSAETEIRNSVDNSERPSTDVSGGGVDLFASVVDAQSTDQLQSLVYNVQSQSLGGSVSAIHDPKPPGRALGVPSVDGSYFTTSKRKPVDTSDEYDSQERKLPIVKRLRSEGNIEAMLIHAEEETALLASMQLIQRRPSGRQLDGPQDKRTFWETQDTGTWHLEYPEMTELQLHVFQATAKARGETFGPNKTPLWDLAMKHFPPTHDTPTPGLAETANNLGGTTRSVTMLDIPSTALQPPDEDAESLPDTLPPDTQQNIVVPKSSGRAAYGVLVSTADSVLGGISLPVTEAMTSWGRHPNNTVVHPAKDDTKVPKFALRILQWREGAEPWVHHLSPQPKPWEHDNDADKYHFYLSTRATMGVHVNGLHVPLTKAGATPHWVRLQHGDEIVIWGAMATPDKAKVAFHCFWGGSSSARVGKPMLESRATALTLEDAYARTERRHKKQTERDGRNAAAREDLAKRNTRFEAELARTDAFEQHILEAREVLKREASATPAASSRSS